MIYTTCNVKSRAIVTVLFQAVCWVAPRRSESLHQHICKDTPFAKRIFFHTYTTIIKAFMGRRRHFPLQLLHTIRMLFFTRSLLDAGTLLCHVFVDVNSFLCNLDHNIFLLWSIRMPRQWGTRPSPRPRWRNTMCQPKHTGGSWWKHSAWIARIRRRDVFLAR